MLLSGYTPQWIEVIGRDGEPFGRARQGRCVEERPRRSSMSARRVRPPRNEILDIGRSVARKTRLRQNWGK